MTFIMFPSEYKYGGKRKQRGGRGLVRIDDTILFTHALSSNAIVLTYLPSNFKQLTTPPKPKLKKKKIETKQFDFLVAITLSPIKIREYWGVKGKLVKFSIRNLANYF